MKVLFDHQAFLYNNYGGVARYFCELIYQARGAGDIAQKVIAGFGENVHIREVVAKRQSGNNEDFWPHADNVQYGEDLVASGHRWHPTFDIRRQRANEDSLVREAFAKTVEIGKRKHGINYSALGPQGVLSLIG